MSMEMVARQVEEARKEQELATEVLGFVEQFKQDNNLKWDSINFSLAPHEGFIVDIDDNLEMSLITEFSTKLKMRFKDLF